MSSDPIQVQSEVPTEALPSLGSEIWTGYRPYLRAIAKDTLVCGTLYLALLIFDWLVVLLPTRGWEGGLIPHLHAVAVMAIFALLSWLSIIDIYQIHRNSHR